MARRARGGSLLCTVIASWLCAQGCGDTDSESPETPTGRGGSAGAAGATTSGSGGANSANSAGDANDADGTNHGGAHSSGDSAGAPDPGSSGAGGTDVGTGEGGLGGDGSAGEASHEAGSGGEAERPKESFMPLYDNGTRLRAVSLGAVGSSTRRFATWYDTELETECEFILAEDGEYRCVPHALGLAPAFLDADCTERVYYDSRVVPCADVPAYRREDVSVDGCSYPRVIRLEPVDTSLVHSACNGVPTELPDGATVWEDAETIAPEALVKATLRTRVNDRGFGVRELVGEDGSRQVISMADAEHGSCAARELADVGMRCPPSEYAWLDVPWWFGDSSCETEPLAYASACARPVQFALKLKTLNPDLPAVLALGEPVTGTVYERGFSSGDCTPRDTAELPWTLYPIEGEYDGTRFFAVTEASRGEGSVQTLHHAIEDEVLTVVYDWPPLFYDPAAEAPCTALRFEDDWLCIPSRVRREVLHYADEDCSEPITYLSEDDPPSLVPFVERTLCSRNGSEDRLVTVYAVRQTYSGSVYEDTGDDCLEVEPLNTAYYRLEAIDPDFPALDEIIE